MKKSKCEAMQEKQMKAAENGRGVMKRVNKGGGNVGKTDGAEG